MEQDIPRAESLLRRSSDQGNRYASYTLGKALLDGRASPAGYPRGNSFAYGFRGQGLCYSAVSDGKAPISWRGCPAGCLSCNRVFGAIRRTEKIPMPHILPESLDSRKRNSRMFFGQSVTSKLPRRTEMTMPNINSEKSISTAKRSSGIMKKPSPICPPQRSMAISMPSSSCTVFNPIKIGLRRLGAIRLLHHLSRMIQNQLDYEKKGKAGAIDRKLKRKIDEKKQAHGLKQG